MRKQVFILMCAAVLASASAVSVYAENTSGREERQAVSETNLFYGTVTKTGEGESRRLLMKANVPGSEGQQDVILNLSGETLVLNAVDGLPVSLEDIQDGEIAYAYVSPAMALSLPPQSFAYVVLTKIPADYRVPSLEEVKTLTLNGDGSAAVETVSGRSFQVPADCAMTPYLTRNMVYVDSLTEGTHFLVWSEPAEDGTTERASKIMVFAKGQLAFDEPEGPAEEAEYRALGITEN